MAWTSSVSAGIGRWAAASVRRMLASVMTPAWSDLARDTLRRLR
jgi:hypothetical protein